MPPKSSPLFTFRLIPAISAMLARRSIDAAVLLDDAGLPLDALRGDVTAPLERVQAFIERAAHELGTDVFGLQLADSLQGGAYGVAEFVVRSAPTCEAGLRALCELAALINPIGQFRFVTRASGEGALHYAVTSERDTLGMHLNEYTLAYIVRQFRTIMDGALPLVEAWFSHARKSNVDVLGKWFGCRLRFQAADCGFAIAPSVLARVPRTADTLLFQFLLAQARAQLARIGPADIVTQVVRVLEARLPYGDLSAEAVAGAMAMKPRSLQRRLADAGTSYRDVLAHVRNRRRAELQSGGVAESEIATQLGFSDARAMRRSLDH